MIALEKQHQSRIPLTRTIAQIIYSRFYFNFIDNHNLITQTQTYTDGTQKYSLKYVNCCGMRERDIISIAL